MANFSQAESALFSENGDAQSEALQTTAKQRDLLFTFLLALALLTLIVAVFEGLLLLFQAILTWMKLRIVGIPESVAGLLQWQTGLIVLAGLVLLAFIFLALARWRALHNRSLWLASGCPSCQEHDLFSVKSRRLDRIVFWKGSANRYQCHSCHWQGRRITIETRDKMEFMDEAGVAADSVEQPPAAAAVLPADDSVPTITDLNGDVPHGINGSDTLVRDEAQEPGKTVIEPPDGDASVANGADAENAATIMVGKPNALSFFQSIEARSQAIDGSPEGSHEDLNDNELASAVSAVIISPFGLNLRASPRSDAEVLGLLEKGTEVDLLGSFEHDNGVVWRQVRAEGQEGWLASAFLRPS